MKLKYVLWVLSSGEIDLGDAHKVEVRYQFFTGKIGNGIRGGQPFPALTVSKWLRGSEEELADKCLRDMLCLTMWKHRPTQHNGQTIEKCIGQCTGGNGEMTAEMILPNGKTIKIRYWSDAEDNNLAGYECVKSARTQSGGNVRDERNERKSLSQNIFRKPWRR